MGHQRPNSRDHSDEDDRFFHGASQPCQYTRRPATPRRRCGGVDPRCGMRADMDREEADPYPFDFDPRGMHSDANTRHEGGHGWGSFEKPQSNDEVRAITNGKVPLPRFGPDGKPTGLVPLPAANRFNNQAARNDHGRYWSGVANGPCGASGYDTSLSSPSYGAYSQNSFDGDGLGY